MPNEIVNIFRNSASIPLEDINSFSCGKILVSLVRPTFGIAQHLTTMHAPYLYHVNFGVALHYVDFEGKILSHLL